MKRVFLFVATNLAILILLGIVTTLLQGYLHAQGIDFPQMSLLLFAAVFGMGGSFISLAISKWMALRSTGAQVIEQPANEAEQWLVETVRQHAQAAGIGMPQVAIFPSESPNAFATGARRVADRDRQQRAQPDRIGGELDRRRNVASEKRAHGDIGDRDACADEKTPGRNGQKNRRHDCLASFGHQICLPPAQGHCRPRMTVRASCSLCCILPPGRCTASSI